MMSHINTTYRHVFVHVPRTCGTSFLQFPFIGQDDEGHRSLRELARQPKYHPDYFHWAFGRNPYDRLVSAYYHVVSCHGFDYCRDFHDFVRHDFDDGSSTPRLTASRLWPPDRGQAHSQPTDKFG
jgi:hypothetical protein